MLGGIRIKLNKVKEDIGVGKCRTLSICQQSVNPSSKKRDAM